MEKSLRAPFLSTSALGLVIFKTLSLSVIKINENYILTNRSRTPLEQNIGIKNIFFAPENVLFGWERALAPAISLRQGNPTHQQTDPVKSPGSLSRQLNAPGLPLQHSASRSRADVSGVDIPHRGPSEEPAPSAVTMVGKGADPHPAGGSPFGRIYKR